MPTTYAIPDGRTVMAATTYTGTGATQSLVNTVNGVSFQPDFVWVKERTNNGFGHALFDSVRGTPRRLGSNLTEAENTTGSFGQVSALNSNGFTVATGSTSFGETGGNGFTYVAWQWKAGGTAVSNTAGTITSSVSANTTAGFSVVTWTGNGVISATVGHGLNAVPAMIICKERTGTDYWHVKHQSTPSNTNLYLNTALANTSAASVGDGVLADLSSSTTFGFATAGSPGNVNSVNENGILNVAYCFASVAGYSAFGSFTGNGSADGPFVYTGFRPAFVMAKLSSATGDWNMVDDMRQTYNDASGNPVLKANTSGAEEDVDTMQGQMDILSNGFKLRSNNSSLNASGGTIIYAAFAKSPFKFANAR